MLTKQHKGPVNYCSKQSLIHTNSSLHNQEIAQFHFKVQKTPCHA